MGSRRTDHRKRAERRLKLRRPLFRLLSVISAAIIAPVLAAAVAAPLAAQCSPEEVTLRGDWGEVRLAVELADTPQSRNRGLMHRETLPARAGMLFLYDEPQPVSFWMKDTLIPLDILFADRSGRITRVHHKAIPGDLTPIPGGDAVFAVLEINGGLARAWGIGPGSEMRHPAFAGGPPAWPCAPAPASAR
ncbi:hypothetical protein SAMN05421849_2066 [Pontibaca methylaminivorans]|uniref:DUF192 domain-containing protein n=1 Tax=Pontibaca methylaminivorans TaxID=515897 RepID=A0A1R3X082_9RHOB|nr:hypothetical protein SAMN05421849_2066 [Pontibaca methylaminivorans]